jgi:hypothetical protein
LLNNVIEWMIFKIQKIKWLALWFLYINYAFLFRHFILSHQKS